MYMTAAAGNNRACFSYEWLTYCYRTMLTRRSLETDFEKIVHAILCLFSGDFFFFFFLIFHGGYPATE